MGEIILVDSDMAYSLLAQSEVAFDEVNEFFCIFLVIVYFKTIV